MKEGKICSDWLALDTIYYNKKNKKISHDFSEVIDWGEFTWDLEGLKNYLDYGYSVFGHTPVRDVCFLMPSTSIQETEHGLLIEKGEDPVERLSHFQCSEDQIWSLLEEKIIKYAKSFEGEVVVPTSGGFDSRIINIFFPEKERIRAFTYGISPNQAESQEVVFAKELCHKLGIQWHHVPLVNFNALLSDWEKIMGLAIHAHGMYHLEFYQEIRKICPHPTAFVSGIIGDVWAKFSCCSLRRPEDLIQLSLNHGLNADSSQMLTKSPTEQRDAFWECYREKLQDPRYQTVWMIHFKIILLAYLIRCPRAFGFEPFSPYLDPEIALAMVQLPENRRKDRLWQREWFQKRRLYIEDFNLTYSSQNSLDFDTIKSSPLSPLNENLFSEIIKPDYVRWVNRQVVFPGPFNRFLHQNYHLPNVRGRLKFLGFGDGKMNAYYATKIKAYNAYLVLWPLQRLIEIRERTCQ